MNSSLQDLPFGRPPAPPVEPDRPQLDALGNPLPRDLDWLSYIPIAPFPEDRIAMDDLKVRR